MGLASTLVVSLLVAAAAQNLEVHLVPHSHCDVGWLYTLDTYFYNGTHGTGSVQDILSTVVANLVANPSFRFIWAETIWLSMWFDLASEAQLADFHAVIASGQASHYLRCAQPLKLVFYIAVFGVTHCQLEIVGGGWSMNDETLPIFADVIDQVTTGHEFIGNNIRAPVGHGWQIDMFSVSAIA